MSDPVRDVRMLPQRIETDADSVQRDLLRLVLTVVELVRQLMEKQALRRVDSGDLTDDQIEALGTGLMHLEAAMRELRERYGLTQEDLNLDLGPLGSPARQVTRGPVGRSPAMHWSTCSASPSPNATRSASRRRSGATRCAERWVPGSRGSGRLTSPAPDGVGGSQRQIFTTSACAGGGAGRGRAGRGRSSRCRRRPGPRRRPPMHRPRAARGTGRGHRSCVGRR